MCRQAHGEVMLASAARRGAPSIRPIAGAAQACKTVLLALHCSLQLLHLPLQRVQARRIPLRRRLQRRDACLRIGKLLLHALHRRALGFELRDGALQLQCLLLDRRLGNGALRGLDLTLQAAALALHAADLGAQLAHL